MARKSGSYSKTTGPKVRTAAIRLIARHGFAAVSMRQIAGEIGLQAGALYSYAASKQAMLMDVMTDHLETRNAAWAATEAPDTPFERLEAYAQFHLGYLLRFQEVSRLVEMEQRNLTPENLEKVQALQAVFEGDLSQALSSGADAKIFAVPEPELAAKGVLAMIRGVAEWAEASDLPTERVQRIAWNMVRRAVGAKGFQ